MNALTIVLIIFVVLESLNVLLLYFSPNSLKGNAVGVFKAFELSKEHPEIHDFIKYLVNWVAGTKLIFVGLLLVILIIGNDLIKLFAVFSLILTIATFYWRLFPLIKQMDAKGLISPPGYAKKLGIMITAFIGVFVAAVIIYHLRNLV